MVNVYLDVDIARKELAALRGRIFGFVDGTYVFDNLEVNLSRKKFSSSPPTTTDETTPKPADYPPALRVSY